MSLNVYINKSILSIIIVKQTVHLQKQVVQFLNIGKTSLGWLNI